MSKKRPKTNPNKSIGASSLGERHNEDRQQEVLVNRLLTIIAVVFVIVFVIGMTAGMLWFFDVVGIFEWLNADTFWKKLWVLWGGRRYVFRHL